MGEKTDRSVNQEHFSTYFSRYAHPVEYLEDYPIVEKLGLVITIPCFNEPELIKTLDALYQCHPTSNPVEILILINQPADPDPGTREQNERSNNDAVVWIEKNSTITRKFHVIFVKDLPEKHFGVGLARKIVMDEAVRRLARSNSGDGIVVGMDADSLCDPDYLLEIERFFSEHPLTTGATIYFEHPLSGKAKKDHHIGIASYELHLRYIIRALRYARFPYAFHTLGSSMAVKGSVYVKQGGMNKRKAGEDFHFLHKIIPLGNFGEINTTRVIPSSRVSSRVPFGTGKAMMKWINSNSTEFKTYNPFIFEELHTLFSGIDHMTKAEDPEIESYYCNLSTNLKKFIMQDEWMEKIQRLQKESTSVHIFRFKFFQWMNGLETLKYIHFARDEMYDNVPVSEAYKWLKTKIGITDSKNRDVFDDLSELRSYDRIHTCYFRKNTKGHND
jgi:hypothetical protein